jgi:hypothetical protein
MGGTVCGLIAFNQLKKFHSPVLCMQQSAHTQKIRAFLSAIKTLGEKPHSLSNLLIYPVNF